MAEPKRLQLDPPKTLQRSKKCKEVAPTYRFELQLDEKESNFAEYSYAELVKGARVSGFYFSTRFILSCTPPFEVGSPLGVRSIAKHENEQKIADYFFLIPPLSYRFLSLLNVVFLRRIPDENVFNDVVLLYRVAMFKYLYKRRVRRLCY